MRITILFFLIFGVVSETTLYAEDAHLQDLSVNIEPILTNGCIRVPAHKEGEGQCCREIPAHLDCSQLGIEKQYGCAPVQDVPNYLGGLHPAVPIVECVFYGEWGKETNDGIRYLGAGMIPVYNKYIVFPTNGFIVLNNPNEFKTYFAPIESPQEALSYVAALTGSYPMFHIELPKGFKREASSITSTFVHVLPGPIGGYEVHLFDRSRGGCGPHHYYSIDYLVGLDGTLKELKRQNIWRNPKDDNLCVD